MEIYLFLCMLSPSERTDCFLWKIWKSLYFVLVQKYEFLSRRKELVLDSLNLVIKMPIQKVDTILFVASRQLLQLLRSVGLSGHLRKLNSSSCLAFLPVPPNCPFCLRSCSCLPKHIKRSPLGLLRISKMLGYRSASRGEKNSCFHLLMLFAKFFGKILHQMIWNVKSNKS